jgi:hypothetical protein
MRFATVALFSLAVLASGVAVATAHELARMRTRASLSREGLSAKSAAETQDETESLAPRARSDSRLRRGRR